MRDLLSGLYADGRPHRAVRVVLLRREIREADRRRGGGDAGQLSWLQRASLEHEDGREREREREPRGNLLFYFLFCFILITNPRNCCQVHPNKFF